MNARWLIVCVLIAVAAGALGYCAHARLRDSAMLPDSRHALRNGCVTGRSFSEIHNTRAAVEELGTRYLLDVTARLQRAPCVNGGGTVPSQARGLEEAILDLEEAMRSFRGTGQEFTVARVLLKALRNSERHDRWLEVYFEILYRHPTQPLIGNLAGEAVLAANAAGLEAKLVAGFEHVTAIPLEFETKERVRRALAGMPQSVKRETAEQPSESVPAPQ